MKYQIVNVKNQSDIPQSGTDNNLCWSVLSVISMVYYLVWIFLCHFHFEISYL